MGGTTFTYDKSNNQNRSQRALPGNTHRVSGPVLQTVKRFQGDSNRGPQQNHTGQIEHVGSRTGPW